MLKCGLKKLHLTKRACGQVGHLKCLCPNVRRYKLLLLSYLPMFKRFPSAETKRGRPCGTIKLLMFNYLRPPHLPQTHVGCSPFCSAMLCPLIAFRCLNLQCPIILVIVTTNAVGGVVKFFGNF